MNNNNILRRCFHTRDRVLELRIWHKKYSEQRRTIRIVTLYVECVYPHAMFHKRLDFGNILYVIILWSIPLSYDYFWPTSERLFERNRPTHINPSFRQCVLIFGLIPRDYEFEKSFGIDYAKARLLFWVFTVKPWSYLVGVIHILFVRMYVWFSPAPSEFEFI